MGRIGSDDWLEARSADDVYASGSSQKSVHAPYAATISIGSNFLGIALSLRYKVPIVVVWSAPGSALLITLLPTVTSPEAVGAYLDASLATSAIGVSGTFDKIVSRLPAGISAAMFAGSNPRVDYATDNIRFATLDSGRLVARPPVLR